MDWSYEGNRIFSKVQKSLWSCTHDQNNPRYPRIKKIHHMIEKITRIDQKTNHCVLLSHDLLTTKFTLHINLQILLMVLIKTSLMIQKSR